MPDPWKGYVSVTDDVRHTYERVFYGRQLTGDNTENMPGVGATAPAETKEPGIGATPEADSPARALYGAEPSHEERQATAAAWDRAAGAPGIQREIESAEGRPYMHTDAAPLEPRGNVHGPEVISPRQAELYGSVWGEGAAGSGAAKQEANGPSIEAPPIEAPKIEPAQPGPTPGD